LRILPEMTQPVLEVQNIAKKYRIQHLAGGYLSLRERMVQALKFEKTNIEDFWALKDVSFNVNPGESIGIIGRNGAGKSTLLKILSKITPPTKGRIHIRGRIASLLEVGTGFHPELTGRENIYFNGSLMGMKRKEIETKFDEIVDFSGVEKFLDTPLKHYSSGMQLRLAFSVAAFLEPEILIVDEVLAVGDAEFQKKCLGKMEHVSKTEGRTILFVSHNLATVVQLCKKAILLREGNLIEMGEVNNVVHSYIAYNKNADEGNKLRNLDLRKGNGRFRVEAIRLLNEKAEPIVIARTGSELIFEIKFDRTINSEEGAFRIDFAIDTEQEMRVGWFSSDAVAGKLASQFDKIYLSIPRFILGEGTYYFTFYSTWNGNVEDYIHQAFSFDVEEGDFFNTGRVIPKFQTFIYTDHKIYSN
jgi:lipopolysaccharide transport system ATP-binding protein